MTTNKKPDLKSITLDSTMSGEDCYEMIAKCAYYKAEKRGFEPGYEVSDWYEAEQEINETMSIEQAA
ncbi:MAG: DUF2934 domain-containing protein [Methylomarinum sp.]|nr:DUF2934 domain-containing protein [Methylomarinum sp.]